MKKTVLQILIMTSALSAFSQNYSNGLYLVNEGNYGTPNGDISFQDAASDSLYEDVFQTANPNEDGFDVLQDFKIENSNAYFLTKSASNEKLVIADASDFNLNTSIDLDGAGPQSINFISDDKAYISCTNSPNLRVLDLQSDSVIGSVSSSVGTFSAQDYIAVYNSSAYIFMGDSIGIIDIAMDSAYNAIAIPNAENSCVGMLINDDKLFVLTNAGWSGDSSRLFRIDLETNLLELSLDLSSLGKARLLQSDGANLYFLVLGDVYKMGVEDDIAPISTFTSSSYVDVWGDLAYGRSFLVDASAQKMFIGSAEEYSGDSSYEILDLSDGSSLSIENPSGGPILNQFLQKSGTLGIANYKKISAVIYPNPARDQLSIEVDGMDEKRISLIDINGNVLKTEQGTKERITWFLDNLSAGIYFVRIQTQENVYTEKVLIYK